MIDLSNVQYKKKIKQLTSKLNQVKKKVILRDEKIMELEAKLKATSHRKRKRK